MKVTDTHLKVGVSGNISAFYASEFTPNQPEATEGQST